MNEDINPVSEQIDQIERDESLKQKEDQLFRDWTTAKNGSGDEYKSEFEKWRQAN